MSSLFWAIVQVAGVLGFQNTEILWFLLPGAVYIGASMFIFAIAVAASFTSAFAVENLSDKIHKEFGYRFLAQIGSIVTAVQLLYIGYNFFAGMAFLQGFVLALTVVLQKIFDEKEPPKA